MRWQPAGLYALVLLSLLARLGIAFLPVVNSFRIGVPDDAYYYFTIARNLVRGFGATSDRLAPTNGFHPLWLLAITPFWFLDTAASEFSIHLALALSALLNVGAGLMVYILARRLGMHSWFALFAAAIFLLNPFGMASGADGLETSLALFLFGVSLLLEWKLIANPRPVTDWIAAGLMWGLLLVARTDYIFLVGGLALQALWHWRDERSGMARRTIALALGAAPPLIPWLAWNWSTFGTISQVSSEAYPYYYHTIWFAEHGTDWLLLAQSEAQRLIGAILSLSRFLGFGRWFLLVALGIILSLRGLSAEARGMLMARLAVPTLLAIFTLGYHVLYRWVYQVWYHAPLAFVAALWIALAVQVVWVSKAKWIGVLALGLLGAFYVNASLDLARSGGVYPGQIENRTRDFCKSHQVIGESDSGFTMYFAPCTVVNLDGVVNNQAFAAIREKRLRDYLERARIESIALNPTVSEMVRLQEGALGETPPWH